MPFAIAPADQDQRSQIHGRGEIEPTVDFKALERSHRRATGVPDPVADERVVDLDPLVQDQILVLDLARWHALGVCAMASTSRWFMKASKAGFASRIVSSANGSRSVDAL